MPTSLARARLVPAALFGLAVLVAALIAVQASDGYFSWAAAGALEPLVVARSLVDGHGWAWGADQPAPLGPAPLWTLVAVFALGLAGPSAEALLLVVPLFGLILASWALWRRGGAASLALGLFAGGLPLLLTDGGPGGLQSILLVAALLSRRSARQVLLGLLMPFAGLQLLPLALLVGLGRGWLLAGLAVASLGLLGLGLASPWPLAALLPPVAPVPSLPLAFLLLAWYWRPRSGSLVLSASALGAVVWGWTQHRVHDHAWRTIGQLARFGAEWQPPGPLAAAPGASLAWRSTDPVVELGCRGSVALARACADDDADAFVAAAGDLVARHGVASVLVDGAWPGLQAPLPVGWQRALTWLDPARPGPRVDLLAVGPAAALAERARDYAWKLPAGTVGTDSPPQVWDPGQLALSDAGDPARCGAGTLVLQLSGADLVDAEGRVHGGAVIRGDREVQLPGPWPAGRYVLQLWAESTTFDGDPGLVALRLGDRDLARVDVPEGPGGVVRLPFALGEATDLPLSLHLLNDAADADHDRNLYLGAVRVHRLASPASSWRQDRLRQDLAGSSVVLISIDTLRADHLGAYGYGRDTSPTIDALAADGVRFQHAISAAHWTAPSHASLLTGLHPKQHGVTAFPDPGRMGDEVQTLAEHLSDRGYATAAFAAGLYVSADLGLGQGFDSWTERTQPADQRFADAAAWLTAQDPDQPFFLFVHSYQVHDPYDPPPPYDQLFAPHPGATAPAHLRQPLAQTWLGGQRPTPDELAWQVALYDGEIRFTDTALGQLLDAIAASGRADDTLVVLTADHGEEFFDHGWVGHGRLYGELLRVPLVLSHPALRRYADATVGQIAGGADVAPTILDLVAGAAPDDMGGRSLLPAMTGDCDPSYRAWSSSQMGGDLGVSWTGLDWHYLADEDREHLFDVASDPRERRDQGRDLPDQLQQLRDDAAQQRARLQQVAPVQAVQRSDEQLQQLRALGYTK